MADMMTFPDTVEEFMEKYKLVDTKQVYTNGTELVPIFRMKQWFEHEAVVRAKNTVASNDCISRQAAIDECDKRGAEHIGYAISKLPSAQPERMKAKWIATTSLQEGQITWRGYKCSNCSHHRRKPMNFCEVCGAKMER